MADIWWIKLTTEMFDDEKIRIIESMPEADTLIVIWIRLICMAGKTNAGGHIFIAPDVPFTIEELSSVVSRPLNVVKLAMVTFQRLKMIEVADNGDIFLPNFQKYQNIEGMERAKEKTRKRVAEFRNRQKTKQLETNTECNATVTLRNAIEKSSSRVDLDKNNIPTTGGVFKVFEESGMGTLSPVMADKLTDLEETYTLEWVTEAIKEAVFQGKRNLRYIEVILQRWQAEGFKSDGRNRKNQPDSSKSSKKDPFSTEELKASVGRFKDD